MCDNQQCLRSHLAPTPGRLARYGNQAWCEDRRLSQTKYNRCGHSMPLGTYRSPRTRSHRDGSGPGEQVFRAMDQIGSPSQGACGQCAFGPHKLRKFWCFLGAPWPGFPRRSSRIPGTSPEIARWKGDSAFPSLHSLRLLSLAQPPSRTSPETLSYPSRLTASVQNSDYPRTESPPIGAIYIRRRRYGSSEAFHPAWADVT